MIIQCLAAFAGSFGFSFVFRIHNNLRFALLGGLVGMAGWMVYLLTGITHNIFLQSFLAMLVVAILAEGLARLLKAPATIFLMVGCFPLVPGKGIYDTMIAAIQGKDALFIHNGLRTLGISLSLSLAILFSATVILIIKQLSPKHN